MSLYGKISLLTLEKYHAGTTDVVDWWQEAAPIYTQSENSQKKSCPRDTFLGLAAEGLIKGTPSGSYTSSKDNKNYAVTAVRILRKRPNLASNKGELWNIVRNGKLGRTGELLSENKQMDVVLALWNQHIDKESIR
jgi:hypothetical protein